MADPKLNIIIEADDRASGDIEKVDRKLDNLGETSGKTSDRFGFLGAGMKAAMGVGIAAAGAAAAAVAGISAAAFDVSMQTERAAANMAASLNVPIETAKNLADVAREVYGNNFAGSVEEAGGAITALVKTMKVSAKDPSLGILAEKAFALSDNFDVDVNEAISAATTLMKEFGVDNAKAFDLLASGFQQGMNRSGDFIDTIEEYSLHFSNAGSSAEAFFGFLKNNMQGGMLGTDKAADLFKEFSIRIQDGSDATYEALTGLGLNVEEVLGSINDGSLEIKDAFDTVIAPALGRLNDPLKENQIGVALMGTQFEDLGGSAGISMELIGDAFEDVGGSADSLNTKYSNLGDMFSALWRKLTVALSPYMDKLLEFAQTLMPHVEAAIELVPPALEILAQQFRDNVLPAIRQVWSFLDIYVMPILSALSKLVMGTLKLGFTVLAAVFTNVTLPALRALWRFIDGFVIRTFGSWKNVIDGIAGAIEGVVNWISNMTTALATFANIRTPTWLSNLSGGLNINAAAAVGASNTTNNINMGMTFAGNAEPAMVQQSAQQGVLSALGLNRQRGGT